MSAPSGIFARRGARHLEDVPEDLVELHAQRRDPARGLLVRLEAGEDGRGLAPQRSDLVHLRVHAVAEEPAVLRRLRGLGHEAPGHGLPEPERYPVR